MLKILINTPDTTLSGGVANHYLGLASYWQNEVRYNTIGRRSNNFFGKGFLFFPYDILKFICILFFFQPDFVLFNPSFRKRAMPRDLFFLWIATFLNIKTGVFIHGWDYTYEDSFCKSRWFHVLKKANVIFVLATEFKDKLVEMGITGKIDLTTTKVDDKLIEKFSNEERTNSVDNILFLSRIEKEKGIYVAIDTFEIIAKKFPKTKLTVVGSGSELNNVKNYSKEKSLHNIEYRGHLRGEELIKEFKNADVYLFPTYAEGMPTSVLEAMAFGLPVITRPVGGLVDFFDKKMGATIQSKCPKDFADAIIELIENPFKKKRISGYNHQYAKSNFMASYVAKNIENKMEEILNK